MKSFWNLSVLFVFTGISASNNNDISDCGDRQRSQSTCCINYYKDKSGKCLACIGSFGTNCNQSCPSGYYGHGCRYKCHCDTNEVCNAQSGCSSPINQTTTVNVNTKERDTDPESSTLETVYMLGLPFAGIFVLTLIFGVAYYCITRSRPRGQSNHGQLIYNNVPKVRPVIVHHTVDDSLQNCSATQTALNGIRPVTHTCNEQTGGNGMPTVSPVNEQDTLESLGLEQYSSGPTENHIGQVGTLATLPANLMVSSPRPTPTTAAVHSAVYTSMGLDANQMNNTMRGDSQFCRYASFENLEKSEVIRPYSSVKYT